MAATTSATCPAYLNPQAEHLLDWFHITMRITVLTQLAKGLCSGWDCSALDRPRFVPTDTAKGRAAITRRPNCPTDMASWDQSPT